MQRRYTQQVFYSQKTYGNSSIRGEHLEALPTMEAIQEFFHILRCVKGLHRKLLEGPLSCRQASIRRSSAEDLLYVDIFLSITPLEFTLFIADKPQLPFRIESNYKVFPFIFKCNFLCLYGFSFNSFFSFFFFVANGIGCMLAKQETVKKKVFLPGCVEVRGLIGWLHGWNWCGVVMALFLGFPLVELLLWWLLAVLVLLLLVCLWRLVGKCYITACNLFFCFALPPPSSSSTQQIAA